MIVDVDEVNDILHYGILRKSGRYPWGSGGPATGGSKNFLGYVEELQSKGMSEVEVARGFGISVTELRQTKSIAKNEVKAADVAEAVRLKAKGLSNSAIGRKMDRNESSVRSLLADSEKQKVNVLQATAAMLRDQVDKKGYIDVGKGVENHLAISQTKLGTAVAALKAEGYTVHYVKVEQLGTGKQTTLKVLAAPNTPWAEVNRNRDLISLPVDFSADGGITYTHLHPPIPIKSKRVAVRYAEEGGAEADGVIYVRRGVEDVSLGMSNYAQVRVAVDGTHYLKGMAMYKDDMPDGVDLVFNTNKSDTGNKLDAMKTVESDPENPFGSSIRRQHGVMNVVNEEGTWETWSRNLSSQMLSKQSPKLARTQLDMTYEREKNSLDEIMSLTNPAVRRKLLDDFADGADSASVHLKAAYLPRQANSVILPIKSLKDTEIYAPNFKNGERVVLVRHPHGGVFEIPELTVNNRNREARAVLGHNAPDAVGIHPKVAERLSGADFDGDTVLVIPNDHGKVKTAPALEGLKDFNPKDAYPEYDGMKRMTPEQKGFAMGDISNLITDMTIKGASNAEKAAAVRHSMVVIDAEKHNLNWRQSAIDNGIPHLKEKYQGKKNAGASTLISRATSRLDVPERKARSMAKGGPVDKATGAKVFEPTGRSFVNAKGKTVVLKERSVKLAETSDAHTLSSGTPVEKIYADHSNKLKALANEARLASVATKSTPYSKSAKAVYSNEVVALNAKLNLALRNSPLERQAQLVANTILSAKRQANPNMDSDDLKRERFRALETARRRTGAGKKTIEITPKEWEAIQAGAITNHKLTQILNNSDIDKVKKLATPRTNTVMTSAKQRRAEQMIASGYSQAEVADALGVALSTLKDSIKREEEG